MKRSSRERQRGTSVVEMVIVVAMMMVLSLCAAWQNYTTANAAQPRPAQRRASACDSPSRLRHRLQIASACMGPGLRQLVRELTRID